MPFSQTQPLKQDQRHSCDSYNTLKRKFRDIGRLSAIGEVLGRDFLTAMPEGAYKSRLNQIAYLYRRIQEDITHGDIRKLIDRATDHEQNYPDDWDEWDRANLREINISYQQHSMLTEEMMEHNARIESEGRRRYKLAKEENDWAGAQDHLKSVIDSEREIAELKVRGTRASSLYEALVQDYCGDIKVSQIETWFSELEAGVKDLIPRIMDKQAQQNPPIELMDFYPDTSQMWLNEELLELFGFDFERGGLYQTGHNPVEGGTPDDTRLVISNANTSNFMISMKSTLHEGGHGLYIQGLPRSSWRYQPVAQAVSAAVHESQAMIIEMMLCRTKEFFEFLSPRLEGLFHAMKDKSLTPENLHRLKNHVKPTPDRKTADEVTYFLHVLLRYRIEKDLIEGKLEVKDIPERWTEDTHSLLGVYPQSHQEGCLQDVHWFVGKFGYFPAYPLGHMMAAQQFLCMEKEIPDLRHQVRRGSFLECTDWLREKIHQKGSKLNTEKLIIEATGRGISTQPLLDHFERRYLSE